MTPPNLSTKISYTCARTALQQPTAAAFSTPTPAVANIPWQYALAHLAAGEGHLQRGGDRAAERHFRLVEWWRGVPERG